MKIEVNPNAYNGTDSFVFDDTLFLIPPMVHEDYWLFRAQLKHGQAIVAFPKYATLGIGFAQETDWNTNLPAKCEPEEIFQHIRHNKQYEDISDDEVREAISAVREVCLRWLAERPR